MEINPFSEQDRIAIDESLKLIQDLIPLIHKVEACGRDCDAHKRRLDEAKAVLERYRFQFCNERRPIMDSPVR